MTAADSGNWKTPSPRILSEWGIRCTFSPTQKRKSIMFHLWLCSIHIYQLKPAYPTSSLLFFFLFNIFCCYCLSHNATGDILLKQEISDWQLVFETSVTFNHKYAELHHDFFPQWVLKICLHWAADRSYTTKCEWVSVREAAGCKCLIDATYPGATRTLWFIQPSRCSSDKS